MRENTWNEKKTVSMIKNHKLKLLNSSFVLSQMKS